MSSTILDFKNLFTQFQSTNIFTKVKNKSKTDWNLNNIYIDFRLFQIELESVDASIADLTNKINRLLFDINIDVNDINELKTLCLGNNIIYSDYFFEIDYYQENYYDYDRDIVINKQPQKGYILNDDNNWVPPTPIPQEGPVGVGSTGVYQWNGENLSWEIVYPGEPN